ncbi:hypothetical protein RCL1_001053 [Eukaryota sp. TZLM3-RCL]
MISRVLKFTGSHFDSLHGVPPCIDACDSLSIVLFSLNRIINKPSFFNILLIPSKSDTATSPLAVNIHGGYAAQLLSSWNLYIISLLYSGISVLIPNYPGSSGYPLAVSKSLNGRIGDVDVEECKRSIDETLKAFRYKKVVLLGGSHGGYLCLVLASKFPSLASAVVVRNPVTDLYACLVSSDIPNWALTACGWSTDSLPTPQMVSSMYERSPVSMFTSITAPVAFHVGGKDLRVPGFQSINLYHMMVARGQEAKMYYYEDEMHSLDGCSSLALFTVNTLAFIRENL